MVFQESTASTWLHLVRGLRAGGQHAVNFFHLVGVLVSAEQLQDIKVFDFVLQLNY